jgi:hypothetical protein
MKNIITQNNYIAVIAITFFLVITLFAFAKVFRKKHIVVGLITVCFMTLAAGACISSIAASIPYMQATLDAKQQEYTDSLFGDYAIDSSMVELNFGSQQ